MAKKKTASPHEKKEQEAANQLKQERLQLLKSRLSIAENWSKKRHEAWRKWIAEYEIEDFDDTSEIRDKVRIGYIFRKTEQEIPAIFDDQPDLFIKGKIKDYRVVESVYNSVYDYLWDAQNLEEKIEDVGVYFELLGMGFMGLPWETKTKTVKEVQPQPIVDPATGQPLIDPNTGEPATQDVEVAYEVPIVDRPAAVAKDPFKLHFSPETKFNSILDTEHCPYYFEKQTWVKEKVKARFNKDVTASDKMFTNESDVDEEISDTVESSSKGEVCRDDLKRVGVVEYYGTLPEELAKDIETTEPWAWDKEYHIFFTTNEELFAEECQYPVKPLLPVGNYGLANKFWKFGDAKHLMPLVQELQMYRSQILQHTRKMANPKPLIEQASEVDEDAFTDPRVGKPVKYQGTPPTYLSPANLGREVEVGVTQARTDLEKTAPSFDLSGGGGSSQVRSPRGIAVYSEAADRGSRRKRKKIGRFIREIIKFQFLQCGMNWTPDSNIRLEIDGKEEPITEEILQVLQDSELLQKVDIEIESLSINKVQNKEDARELWEIAVAAPNIFNIVEIARDLLQNGYNKRDADRYLISMDQQNQQAVQAFIQQLSQTDPELAAAVMQQAQNPNMAQMEADKVNASKNPAEQTAQPATGDDGLPALPSF